LVASVVVEMRPQNALPIKALLAELANELPRSWCFFVILALRVDVADLFNSRANFVIPHEGMVRLCRRDKAKHPACVGLWPQNAKERAR